MVICWTTASGCCHNPKTISQGFSPLIYSSVLGLTWHIYWRCFSRARFSWSYLCLPCVVVYFLVNSQFMASFLVWMEILVLCFQLMWIKVRKKLQTPPHFQTSRGRKGMTWKSVISFLTQLKRRNATEKTVTNLLDVWFSHCLKKKPLHASLHLEKIKTGNRSRFVTCWLNYVCANNNFWCINNNHNFSVVNEDKAMQLWVPGWL